MFIDVSELGRVEHIDVCGQKIPPFQADMIINFNHVNIIAKSGSEIGFIMNGMGDGNKLIYIFKSDQEASEAMSALLERLNK